MFQIDNLDGSKTSIRPTIPEMVGLGDVSVKILDSNGPTSISKMEITVCCHPQGKRIQFDWVAFAFGD